MTEKKEAAPAKQLATPWERIDFAKSEKGGAQPAELFRLKVPGGWLVAPGWGGGVSASALVFIADNAHEWNPYA